MTNSDQINSKPAGPVPIFLIGYRCTGKTTTGKLLAKMLGRPFVDTDQALESGLNTSIAQMVGTRGWAYFRERETRVLLGLDLAPGPVVATGGGIVLSRENRKFIQKSGDCAWLDAPVEVLVSRIRDEAEKTDHRPDLTSQDLEAETREMVKIRTPLYRKLSRICINTAEHSPGEAARIIKRRFDHDRL